MGTDSNTTLILVAVLAAAVIFLFMRSGKSQSLTQQKRAEIERKRAALASKRRAQAEQRKNAEEFK